MNPLTHNGALRNLRPRDNESSEYAARDNARDAASDTDVSLANGLLPNLLQLHQPATESTPSIAKPIARPITKSIAAPIRPDVPVPTLPVPLFPDHSGPDLLDQLRRAYSPKATLGYNRARDILYSRIDNRNGLLTDLYSGYKVLLNPRSPHPTELAERSGLNAEHIWPQSKGATDQAKSDLHNLFTTTTRSNSARSSYPFGEVPDDETRLWFLGNQARRTKPTRNIDDYSEFRPGLFEPREAKKGDIARAMFYFRTMYPEQADLEFFESQRATLCEWHRQDPVDPVELARSRAIAQTAQGNENPFVLDPTLAERTFCK